MAWEYSPKEFIKMYRKFMNWEWYTNVNTKALFIHCLLRANWKAGEWQGIHYKEGEFITSLPTLGQETGLTVRQVRVSLEHLISTGEVTSKTTDEVTGKKLNKCRIIAINNWNEYQTGGRQNDSQSGSRHVNQTTGSTSETRQSNDRRNGSRYKNNKNIRNKEEKEAAANSAIQEEEHLDLWDESWEEQ